MRILDKGFHYVVLHLLIRKRREKNDKGTK